MKIHLKALGCRLNEAELEQWSQSFQAKGHKLTPDVAEADVLVLNSCAVTNEASAKSRRLLNRLYRDNPAARMVVSGCYATLQPEEAADLMGVDMVVPNEEKDQLPEKVMQAFELPIMPKIATEAGENTLFVRGRHRAFIKIQDGCRYRCTFCIVTVARGDERSRSIDDLVTEIQQLEKQGIQEVVLTGVHVGGYGSDLDSSLYELVKAVLEQTAVPRIRFASVEPWDLPENFFELFANPRLMPHMHLPIQSGSDSVLRHMARRCKTTEFASLVANIRETVPNFTITTDIIVGFPGETEEEWQETLSFVEQMSFGHIHIFSYSKREGTKAARLPHSIDGNIKKERSRALHDLASQSKQGWLEQQIGLMVDVLWEQQREQDGCLLYSGYTPNYCKVQLSTKSQQLENKITRTKLVGLTQEGVLIGELV